MPILDNLPSTTEMGTPWYDNINKNHVIGEYEYLWCEVAKRPAALVGEPCDPNKANRTKARQIAKFGMIVYYKIVINNLI